MWKPRVSQIPDGLSRLKPSETWRFQIVAACRIFLETLRMYSFRNGNLLKRHFYNAETLRILLVVC